MRGAARGDIEIVGKIRHFPHETNKPALPAAGKARLALLLDWPANFVAARQPVDLGAMIGQPCQKICKIFELLSDDVDYARFLLHETANRDIARTENHWPQALEYLRPYNHIGDRRFVFNRHEDDAIG